MREGVREAEDVEETTLITLLIPSPLCVLLSIYGIHQDSAPSSAYTSTNPGFFALWISLLQTPMSVFWYWVHSLLSSAHPSPPET